MDKNVDKNPCVVDSVQGRFLSGFRGPDSHIGDLSQRWNVIKASQGQHQQHKDKKAKQ